MNSTALEPRQSGSTVVEADAGNLMEVISRAASDPNTDVDKLERLMGLYERITAKSAETAFSEAFAAMQIELPEIPERGTAHNSTYALWEDINDLIKPILSEHGFGLSFRVNHRDDKIAITAVLTHKTGHSEQTTMEVPADHSGSKNAVQAIGSSTSYGKRYAAQALLNLTSRGEDDDGAKGGAGQVISEDQLLDLRALVEEVKADEAKFCAYFRVDALASLPANKYDAAVKALQAKRGQ